MSKYRRVVHAGTGQTLVPCARWGDTFLSKLRGFTLRAAMEMDEGLILVHPKESRVNSAIHMLFVFFPLGVIWLDDDGVVVDLVLALPWRPHYAPKKAARYVLEAHPDVLPQVQIGDQLQFEPL